MLSSNIMRHLIALIDVYKFNVSFALLICGVLFQAEVIGKDISHGVRAALFALGAAVPMVLSLIPEPRGGGTGIAVSSDFVAKLTISLLALGAGYNWLQHEASGDIRVYFLVPMLLLIGSSFGITGGALVVMLSSLKRRDGLTPTEKNRPEMPPELAEEYRRLNRALANRATHDDEVKGRALAVEQLLTHMVWREVYDTTYPIDPVLESMIATGEEAESDMAVAFGGTAKRIKLLADLTYADKLTPPTD